MMQEQDQTGKLPPRRKAHPSYRWKWSRRFYGMLVLLFCSLIMALIAWFHLHPV